MTNITIDTRSESGLFFVHKSGKSQGFKTLAEARTAAEAIKADLGGKAEIREI